MTEKGLNPKLQSFSSCFGEGKNIYVEYGNNYENTTIISAHYDGESFFDNSGGVIALLNVSKEILVNEFSSTSLVLLFTDQEETYQQGAANFLRDNCKYYFTKNINIDGFGIGDELYKVSELVKNSNSEIDLFLCDSDEFLKFGIPSTTYFSAFSNDYLKSNRNNNIYSVFVKYHSESFYFKKYSPFNTKSLFQKLNWEINKSSKHE